MFGVTGPQCVGICIAGGILLRRGSSEGGDSGNGITAPGRLRRLVVVVAVLAAESTYCSDWEHWVGRDSEWVSDTRK